MADTRISALPLNPTPPSTGKVVYFNPTTGNDELATFASVFTADQAVSSVFGRTGVITAQVGDYSAFYVQGGQSPSFTNISLTNNSNQLALGTTNIGTLTWSPSATRTLTLPDATDTVVGRATTDTLTNKTLTNPAINNGTLTGVNLVTSSVTSGLTLSGATSGGTVLAPIAIASGTITIPSATDTLVARATTDTLTNKTIAAGSNTITGLVNANLSGSAAISNANLANSSVTVTAGAGMSGGGAVSLGGSVTLTNAGVTSNVAGAGVSVSGATGAVTITNTGVTSAVAGTAISVSGATGAVTINNTGVTSLTGTTNQVSVSGSTGAVTLSTPQNIHTAATPTFAGLTLNGASGNILVTDTSTLVVDATNHRVGLGNATPRYQVDLNNNTANTKLAVYADSGSSMGIGAQSGLLRFNLYNAASQRYGFFDGTTTELLTIRDTGRVGIGQSSPTAELHIAAGTAAANTSPIKLTSGTNLTSPEAGTHEYNGNHYLTNAGPLRFSIGGTLFDHFADAGNTHTDGATFDDLYSDTLAANTFNVNGDKVRADYSGTFVASATASRDIKILFAGSTILDTGALTTVAAESWDIDVLLIRESSTVVRCMATIWSSTSLGAGAFTDTTYTRLTGLTLSGTNILKIQAVSGATGAAANDVVAKLATVVYQPSA